jgi:acetylornithine deacetylase/succinyl-diaminopimelate desuccinylase-like protein
VICLDAECGNYEQLWCTTSLRGNLIGTLDVQVLTEGVHSGSGSGTVPSSVRVLRQLLERIEDAATGAVRGEAFAVEISERRRQQAEATAQVLGAGVWDRFPFVPGARAVTGDPVELILNTTWRSTLTITGIEGLPALRDAGNVLVPQVSAKLSFRLPPTGDPQRAAQEAQRILERDPPYGAHVKFTPGSAMGGWDAPAMAPWLEESVQRASRQFFGRDVMFMGTGGSIPFMGMLGERFPRTQFVVTGVLGPHANAHGPNEFLHLETVRRVTACVAQVLADHGRQ